MEMDFTSYREKFEKALQSVHCGEIPPVLDLFCRARKEGRTVFIIGNGGSAANASHACEDLMKGTLVDLEKQRRLRILSFTDNVPAITAWANDEGYERIFIEQLRTFARPGDLLVAISGSGMSANVIEAVRWANSEGLITVAFTGYDGGILRREARFTVHVPVQDMGIVEAVHSVLFHYFVSALRERFAEEDGLEV